jgi:hypothetical protein
LGEIGIVGAAAAIANAAYHATGVRARNLPLTLDTFRPELDRRRLPSSLRIAFRKEVPQPNNAAAR